MISPLMAGLSLIMLHGPGGQYLEINSEQISSVRIPRSNDHFPKGTRCILTMTNGKLNAVMETCEMVDQLIKQLPRDGETK
jgi:hypothetical protein